MDNIGFIDISKITVDKDHLIDVRKNLEFNKSVIKHYRKLLFHSRFLNNASFRKSAQAREDFNKDSIVWNHAYTEKVLTIENKLANLSNCNSLWLLDVYDTLKVKDFIKTNLCKDRFCANCKKVKQASRMSRFIPEIDKYKDNDLYHLTLTVPNVSGDKLRYMIDIMFKSFTRLVNYFKATKKYYISGIDFSKFNYLGAIRSLEVTYRNGSFHPHIHCLLALDYPPESKVNENKFSLKYGKVARKFSDSEILIQKIWKLLILQETITKDYKIKIDKVLEDNDLDEKKKQKEVNLLDKEYKKEFNKNSVTKKAIDSLELGYSCSMDIFKEDDYHELFKYMTKAQSDDEKDSTYQDFLHLYFQLKSVRQIQGYGVFFRIKDTDSEDEVDLNYDTWKSIMDSIERPRVSSEKTDDLILDHEYTLTSRKKHYSYLRLLEEKEKEGCEPSLKNG